MLCGSQVLTGERTEFGAPLERFLTTGEMCDAMGWSRTTLWRRIREGTCVKPVKRSATRNGFPLSEVRALQQSLMEARGR
jgi:predicted DNA-binding transcriptional regulator AlpA